jgi:hypothetical protein
MRKEILIREAAGVGRTGEYVRVALPCARGELQPGTELCVRGPNAVANPCQRRVLKAWPDGSVKWLLLDFAATVPAGGELSYHVSPAPAELASGAAVRVDPGAGQWMVHTGAGSFAIDSHVYRPFISVLYRGKELLEAGVSRCRFSLDGTALLTPHLEQVELEEPGPLHAVLRLTGSLAQAASSGTPGLRFSSRLHFFAGSMAVRVEFTLHNPQAARHPGGLWDLGDPGSLLFRELSLEFSLPDASPGQVRLLPEPGGIPLMTAERAGLSLYQESSGGEHWRSANHRNRDGKVPFERRGYLVESAGEALAAGLRATPSIWLESAAGIGIAAAVPLFWQEFPKEIAAGKGVLKIGLFPGRFPDQHELQGGEQKTQAFWLDFAARPDALAWAHAPLQAISAPSEYRDCGIFHDLPGADDLIDRFATCADLLAKRELLDEYGWRNFGELYADHEAVYHRGEGAFVSHYNNQYDFCAGAYRKAFATGEPAWRELAADLARHVRDIDLYHTEMDREEYNGGMFWHTDHYVAAGLSSHRSYSGEQLKGRAAQQCGGGPGPEHCYTTGLLLHYFQTGDPDFQQAVIRMAEWELVALEGPQTLLAALKRAAGYFSLWRSSRGTRRLFPRYPLTRGTGNAITACLDAFEVGGGRRFLDKAESLLRGTLHPADDISARNLLDAEVAWSYSVMLVSVAKYLEKKWELGEIDAGFAYARGALLAYAEWMAQHEYSFLEKPELLEYPNETWAAQDLRKSVVFYHASRHALPERRALFLEKASFFFSAAQQELLRHPTARLTRPLVLMLQNGWVQGRLGGGELSSILPVDCQDSGIASKPTPHLELGPVLARIGAGLLAALKNTSLRKELDWFQSRL